MSCSVDLGPLSSLFPISTSHFFHPYSLHSLIYFPTNNSVLPCKATAGSTILVVFHNSFFYSEKFLLHCCRLWHHTCRKYVLRQQFNTIQRKSKFLTYLPFTVCTLFPVHLLFHKDDIRYYVPIKHVRARIFSKTD